MYARPIIIKDNKIVNDLDKIFFASDYVDYVVCSSVRIDDNIKSTDINNLLPEVTGSCLHKSHKCIPNQLFVEIENILINMCSVPVFRKTSCVISTILGIPDYNCHWADSYYYSCKNCNQIQRSICEKQNWKIPTYSKKIQEIIDRYRLPSYVKSVPGAWVLESNMSFEWAPGLL